MRPRFEVAHLAASYGEAFLGAHPQRLQVVKTLGAITRCRTAALGGHKLQCNCCDAVGYRYNSCRNRHCPKCQGINREKWITHREAELLPVGYFHMVFTLPHELNQLAMHEPTHVYNSLFRAAWHTIAQFSSDHKHLGAKTGMTAVLHTWGQNLSLHPHLHCIVPGGGITAQGNWRQARNKGKPGCRKARYLFPTKALATVFRAKFMEALRASGVKVDQSVAKALFSKGWVVYAKQPFAGPKQVIEYLGRYTHKIAISNHRIKALGNDGSVTFSYKDYRQSGKKKLMTLQATEFLRRFCQHILPHGFVRIRHYGMLASRNKATLLNTARDCFGMEHWQKPEAINWKTMATERLGFAPDQCLVCKEGVLQIVAVLEPERGPPMLTLKPNTAF